MSALSIQVYFREEENLWSRFNHLQSMKQKEDAEGSVFINDLKG